MGERRTARVRDKTAHGDDEDVRLIERHHYEEANAAALFMVLFASERFGRENRKLSEERFC